MHQHGNIVVIGMAAGIEFSHSVMPFILRYVSQRDRIWSRLAQDLYGVQLDSICASGVALDELPAFCWEMLAGHVHGRAVVRIT